SPGRRVWRWHRRGAENGPDRAAKCIVHEPAGSWLVLARNFLTCDRFGNCVGSLIGGRLGLRFAMLLAATSLGATHVLADPAERALKIFHRPRRHQSADHACDDVFRERVILR